MTGPVHYTPYVEFMQDMESAGKRRMDALRGRTLHAGTTKRHT